MFCLRSFISNKEHWQEKELQSFIYLDDILYFFFQSGTRNHRYLSSVVSKEKSISLQCLRLVSGEA